MGAWGEGMQANDTALDYIAEYQDFSKEHLPLNKKGGSVVDGKKPILGELKKIDEDMGILGVAEFFLDHGVDLEPAKSMILKTIKRQLSKKELDSWCDREIRKAALERFRGRVMGKNVDPNLLKGDNKGLLDRIGDFMKERSR